MTEIYAPVSDRRRAGIKRSGKLMPKPDMTPMVDLGFLLIAFFVITTELSKPVTVKLAMPKDGPPVTVGNSSALTVLLDEDKVYYYHGNWQEAVGANKVLQTNLSATGLRKIIQDKKHWLQANESREGGAGLMLLVKATEKANYKSLVDILDETIINDVKKYAFIKIEAEESAWIKKQP